MRSASSNNNETIMQPQQRKKTRAPREVTRVFDSIEDVTFWVVQLWPDSADPECFVQDPTAEEPEDAIDNMPLRTAKVFASRAEAFAEAKSERLANLEMSSLSPKVRRARKTNAGAEVLLNYRIGHRLMLSTMSEKLGLTMNPKAVHGLCWGFVLPTLPLAARIRDLANVPLDAWLEPVVTIEFPRLRFLTCHACASVSE